MEIVSAQCNASAPYLRQPTGSTLPDTGPVMRIVGHTQRGNADIVTPSTCAVLTPGSAVNPRWMWPEKYTTRPPHFLKIDWISSLCDPRNASGPSTAIVAFNP